MTDGKENVVRRLPIVVTPIVAQYTTRPSDLQRVANWQVKGLREMEFTSMQLTMMRQLSISTIDFAAVSGNKYIPTGYGLDDLLGLYPADTPRVPKEHYLILRALVAKFLQPKIKMKDQILARLFTRLDRVEDTLQENQEFQDISRNWK